MPNRFPVQLIIKIYDTINAQIGAGNKLSDVKLVDWGGVLPPIP
jgi:hypothetical protein